MKITLTVTDSDGEEKTFNLLPIHKSKSYEKFVSDLLKEQNGKIDFDKEIENFCSWELKVAFRRMGMNFITGKFHE